MARAITRLFFAIWLVMPRAVYAQANDSGITSLPSAKLVSKYKSAIVYVEATFREPESEAVPRTDFGIGFIFTKAGFLLTAAHVISPKRQGEVLEKVTGSIRTPDGSKQPLNLVLPSNNADVALLQMPDTQDVWTYVDVDLPMSPIAASSPICILSIPPGEKRVRALCGNLDASGTSHGANWVTDVRFKSGESGCPIFNDAGRVVALCEGGLPGDSEVTYAKPIAVAQDLVSIGRQMTPTFAGAKSPLKSVVLFASSDASGKVTEVSQRYCAPQESPLSLSSFSSVTVSRGATLDSIIVDPSAPNCMKLTATIPAYSQGGFAPETSGWVGVGIAVKDKRTFSPVAASTLVLDIDSVSRTPIPQG